jgi:hypothetical protein
MLPKLVDSQIKSVVETASRPFQEGIHYRAERFPEAIHYPLANAVKNIICMQLSATFSLFEEMSPLPFKN